MSRRSQGIGAERSLVKIFQEKGYSAIRVAGSGTMKDASADILAGNSVRILAIECKTARNDVRYIEKEQILQLRAFAKTFGAEPWIAIKFSRKPWYFLPASSLDAKTANIPLRRELVEKSGLTISFF